MKRRIFTALAMIALFVGGYHIALYEIYNDCLQVGVAEVMPVNEYVECVVLEDVDDVEEEDHRYAGFQTT